MSYVVLVSLFYSLWVVIETIEDRLTHDSVGEILVPDSVIRPVVSVSSLTWVIRYIYYWNLQFLNNVIIIKTKVFVILVDFSHPD